MVYTDPPVITRHITPQKAAFKHYFEVPDASRAVLYSDYSHDL